MLTVISECIFVATPALQSLINKERKYNSKDLIKEESKYKFENEQRKPFNDLKKILSPNSVLGIYNPTYETELHWDTCISGYSGGFLQNSEFYNCFHLIYYSSTKITANEQKNTSYEVEVLAIS